MRPWLPAAVASWLAAACGGTTGGEGQLLRALGDDADLVIVAVPGRVAAPGWSAPRCWWRPRSRPACRRGRAPPGLLGVGVLVAAGHLLLPGISGVILAISATLIGLLVWRLARADIGLGAAPFVVDSTRQAAEGTVEISLRPLSLPIRAVPGQFILTAFHEGGGYFGCREYHPFTVSAIDPGGVLRIGVKALGDCSRRMQSVTPGTPVRVQGPFGVFMAERRSDPLSPEIWIAGGIGITPFGT